MRSLIMSCRHQRRRCSVLRRMCDRVLTGMFAERTSSMMQAPRRTRLVWLAFSFATLMSATMCSSDPAWSGDLGYADFAMFERDVYPVLMRDCGFANCHGVEQRAFQVWGPGRSRLDTRAANIVEQEHVRTYARALSMLYTDGSRPLNESLLLTKPLEISAGGATHGGVDLFGRNVYRTRADLGFQVLWRWAQTSPGTAASGAAGAQ